VARPRDSDSAHVHERITTAAATLLESVGPSAVTMREIAKAAEVSLGTVHYYFPNKETLLDAVFEAILADSYQVRDELIRALSSSGAAERLQDAVRIAFRTALRIRPASRLMQIMALDQGFIPQRRRVEEDLILAAVSEVAQRTLGTTALQARLLVKSLLFCIGRYATLSVDELRRVTGLPADLEESAVYSAVEDHLVQLMTAVRRA
jgi:AcrR family transcriptional regulator